MTPVGQATILEAVVTPEDATEVVSMTSGCFDLLHTGHLRYLQRCRTLCDRLVVAVDSDEMVRAAKGDTRPIYPQDQRVEMLEGLACVDKVQIIWHVNMLKDITIHHKVNKVFKTGRFEKSKVLHGVNGTSAKLVIVDDLSGMPSTTKTIERIRRCSPGVLL